MDVNPHSAYHAAGIKLLPGGVGVNDVACSGGIGGGSTPLCSRTRYTLRTRTTYAQAQAFPSVAAYASASHSAMHTPVDVTGIEPATACLQSPGLSTFDHTLRFFSVWGIGDPVVGGRTPFAGLAPAVLEVHAPSRQDKVKGVITSSLSSRFFQAPLAQR